MRNYFVLLGLIFGCSTNDSGNKIPSIHILGMSRTTMLQGDLNQDSVIIDLSFKDGDGDLGWGSTDNHKDIFVIDKRTNLISDNFKIPDIPDSKGQSIEGNIQIRLYTSCCIFPNNIPPCSSPPQFPFDTISYEIYIVDRAGNESNHALSSNIFLKCE